MERLLILLGGLSGAGAVALFAWRAHALPLRHDAAGLAPRRRA